MRPNNTSQSTSKKSSWVFFGIIFSFLISILAAILVYQLDSFDPAPFPNHKLTRHLTRPKMKNSHILRRPEFLGVGKLKGPEDIVYDSKSKVMYTSCREGWTKRVTVNESVRDSVVENWVKTGGRPLGLAMHGDQFIVVDAYKGLLKINGNGGVEVLTNEAEGIKLKLTDSVDIAEDGTIYFTDALYKYNLRNFLLDILEGKPHGRLLSYDPSTKETKVLVHNLYFANGIAISPHQDYAVYCETPMRRCKKYYIQGNSKGSVESFINVPGLPNNIHYDGNGHFWIVSAMELTAFWKLAFKYSFVRKAITIYMKHIGSMKVENSGGIFVVNLDGKVISHYYDPHLRLISSGKKIGAHLYCGSLIYPYIIRLNLSNYSILA